MINVTSSKQQTEVSTLPPNLCNHSSLWLPAISQHPSCCCWRANGVVGNVVYGIASPSPLPMRSYAAFKTYRSIRCTSDAEQQLRFNEYYIKILWSCRCHSVCGKRDNIPKTIWQQSHYHLRLNRNTVKYYLFGLLKTCVWFKCICRCVSLHFNVGVSWEPIKRPFKLSIYGRGRR